MKFERIIKFAMPFDKRSDIPENNYGICSMRIWFILKGTKGAVQVMIGTNLYLSSTINEYSKKGMNLFEDYDGKDKETFDCWDVGYHSKKSMFEGQSKNDCNILDTGFCYYDGSSLRGKTDKIGEIFLEKGEDAIWEYLEKYYEEVFGEGK